MLRKYLKRLVPLKTPEQKARNALFSVEIKKGDIAIDCGANVGEITQYFYDSGATVYAFEPNPYAYEVLKNRFSGMKNVHCIPKGVSDSNGIVKLYMHENSDDDEVYWSTGSSLLEYKGNVSSEKYIDVGVVDLCEFIESIKQRVKVLKMDVEGVECAILKKMIEKGITNNIDHIFVETHEQKIPELAAETNHIRELIAKNNIRNINLDWV